MNYNRFTIDTIKECFDAYVTSGTIPVEKVNDAILKIEIAIDNIVSIGGDAVYLELLKNDLEDVRKIYYAKSY
jgi:hypothetical protein